MILRGLGTWTEQTRLRSEDASHGLPCVEDEFSDARSGLFSRVPDEQLEEVIDCARENGI